MPKHRRYLTKKKVVKHKKKSIKYKKLNLYRNRKSTKKYGRKRYSRTEGGGGVSSRPKPDLLIDSLVPADLDLPQPIFEDTANNLIDEAHAEAERIRDEAKVVSAATAELMRLQNIRQKLLNGIPLTPKEIKIQQKDKQENTRWKSIQKNLVIAELKRNDERTIINLRRDAENGIYTPEQLAKNIRFVRGATLEYIQKIIKEDDRDYSFGGDWWQSHITPY